jgi:hypothetical protein
MITGLTPEVALNVQDSVGSVKLTLNAEHSWGLQVRTPLCEHHCANTTL